MTVSASSWTGISHAASASLSSPPTPVSQSRAPRVATPVTAERDKTKISVLKQCFSFVAEEQSHGRRVTVYERLGPDHCRAG